MERELSFDDAYAGLKQWARTLLSEADRAETEVRNYMNPAFDKGDAPSAVSWPLMAFKGVEDKLYEVQGFVRDVRKAIAREAGTGKHSKPVAASAG